MAIFSKVTKTGGVGESSLSPLLAPTPSSVEILTKEDLEFILLKLRSATYRGEEFETFYSVWMKILTEIETRQ